MARLYRPHIPVEVRCRVALRQLEYDTDRQLEAWKGRLGELLLVRLAMLASKFGCEIPDLRLDHDPPLAAREQIKARHPAPYGYRPDANDPAHLLYRPHGPEFSGSHLIKTNVRGDHGQHPDRVLIKKARRLERGPKPKRGPKIKSRGFSGTRSRWPKPLGRS